MSFRIVDLTSSWEATGSASFDSSVSVPGSPGRFQFHTETIISTVEIILWGCLVDDAVWYKWHVSCTFQYFVHFSVVCCTVLQFIQSFQSVQWLATYVMEPGARQREGKKGEKWSSTAIKWVREDYSRVRHIAYLVRSRHFSMPSLFIYLSYR